MQFRFYFYNDTLAPSGIEVSQPDGWKDAKLVLERHKDYSSLIEYFEGDFVWYGTAMQFLISVEDNQGVDATVRLVIQVSFQMTVWEDLFDGRLDLSMLEENSKGKFRYKMKVPIIRNNTWAKFINRKSIPVDLLSTTDIDGNTRAVESKITLPLPSQTIHSKFNGALDANLIPVLNSVRGEVNSEADIPDTIGFVDFSRIAADSIVQLSFSDNVSVDEVKDRFDIIIDIVDTGSPNSCFKAKYEGSYHFVSTIELSIYSSLFQNSGSFVDPDDVLIDYTYQDYFNSTQAYIEIYFQKNNETPIIFSMVDPAAVDGKSSTVYSFDETIDLLVNDEVKFYAKIINNAFQNDFPTNPLKDTYNAHRPGGAPELIEDNEWRWYITYMFIWGKTNQVYEPRFNIIKKATFSGLTSYYGVSSIAPLMYDFGDGSPITSEAEPTILLITADTVFPSTTTDSILLEDAGENILSKIVGRDDALVSDALDSCKGNYTLQKCLHIRGYKMSDKPMFMSWDDWWKGAEPILCLGLAEDGDQIRVEGKEYFYNKTVVVNLSNIADIIRTYDKDKYYKSINYGYEAWSAESEGGIDDPQAKGTRRTKFIAIGNDAEQLSKFYAASLGIEQTRRNRVEFAKDWRLDEKIAIIAVKSDGEGGYTPEIGSDFDSVTNLNNPDSRYNIRISASRNFDRYKKVYNGCLAGTGEKFYFASGEGNYDMTTTLKSTDCEFGQNNDTISEKQDIDSSDDFLILPKKYSFKHPLSWSTYKSIRDNRHNAIGLSRTSVGHSPHFIEKLEYFIVKGYGQFNVNLGDIGDFLLLETGFNILTESGGRIKLE